MEDGLQAKLLVAYTPSPPPITWEGSRSEGTMNHNYTIADYKNCLDVQAV